MKRNISRIFFACGVSATLMMQSCSLDEYNPGGSTLEAFGYSAEGYQTLVNQCYFGLERQFYNGVDFMGFMEGNTDLWTAKTNQLGQNDQVFKFFAGAAPNLTFTNALWNAAYDGVGACNIAIENAANCPFKTTEERNAKVAEAHFLRAVYFYHLVETFGGVVKLTEVVHSTLNYAPDRTEPLEIYRDVIIPDLRFAAEWLPKGDDSFDGRPTKKAALGFLAKACLTTQQYGTTEFLQEGYNVAKDLISDCESGGSKYNTYMYPAFEDVFKEANNKNNKEALWKYTINPKGSSNGNYRTNRNDEHFLCQLNHFGARIDNQATRLAWDGGVQGDFMPTQHLLSLYVQADGTLDPRFHKSFITEWDANQAYTWTEGDVAHYGKNSSVEGTAVAIGDPAIRFVMPQDPTYASEVASKATSPYVLIEYKDVYDHNSKSIIMTAGDGENHYRYFYPSLNKHASSNYYVANASKMRNGNLNGVIPMRMAEVYLMAAEFDILLNGGGSAMGYINTVRQRAGANPLTGSADISTVLDERGRELCGEFTRFYDLKRTGMYKSADYLLNTFPELGKYFQPKYALRPIPSNFTDVISNGSIFNNY